MSPPDSNPWLADSSFARLLGRWRRQPLGEGEDVLLKGQDGLLYFGVVVETDADTLQCLVRFGDCTERWSPFYDLKRLGEADEGPAGLEEEEEDILGPPKLVPQVQPAETLVSRKAEDDDLLPLKKPRLRPKPQKVPLPAHVVDARNSLPYQFDHLRWDLNHARNEEQRYCYCGESGDWYRRMLQCGECLQWFHQECLRKTSPPILLGDGFFEFVCALCTGKTEEVLERLDLSWAEALHLVLFNLTLANSKRYHDLDSAVIPFFRRRWQCLQGPGAILKPNRIEHSFLHNVLKGNKTRFKCGSEIKKRSTFWGLRKVLPPSIPLKLGGDGPFLNFKLNLDSVPRGAGPKRTASRAPSASSNQSSSNGICGSAKGGHQSQNGLKPARRRGRPARKTLDSNDQDSDDASSRGTLDSFIPPPKDFMGFNNPFRNLNLGPIAEASLSGPKDQILDDIGGLVDEEATTHSTHSSPPSLEPLEPYKSKRNSHRSHNAPGSPMLLLGAQVNSAIPGSSFEDHLNGASGLFASTIEADDALDPSSLLTDLQASLNNYFGAENRINKGERFNVNARRLTMEGDVQYLIEWEHPGPLSPTVELRQINVPSSSLAMAKRDQSDEDDPVDPKSSVSC
eukprot:maker-scaffold179_size282488-snap-gene-1.22 protein:Tk10712 transcript:maker-scaffold179_size282488-snap-gene-1.22-mRNA-1 annotation:"metal-response element-binding transcription factor 2"